MTDSETIRSRFIAWSEAHPEDAALLLSRTANDRPIIELIDLISWGRSIGIKGLPDTEGWRPESGGWKG